MIRLQELLRELNYRVSFREKEAVVLSRRRAEALFAAVGAVATAAALLALLASTSNKR